MKKYLLLIAAISLMFAGIACDSSSTDANDVDEDPLFGVWVSEGENVAPGLAGPPFNNVRIEAQFNDDNTYFVESTDAEGASVHRNLPNHRT